MNRPLFRKHAALLVIVAALFVAGVQTTRAQQTDAQIEKRLASAQHKATVDGDLKGAIEEYKKIVAGAGANRALAAQALLGMAACYDKLGQQGEARSTYERVAREYPTQKQAVTEAQAWLNANGGASQQTKLSVERIWTGPGVNLEGLAFPDGRYMAFIDWTQSANLAVRDLSTGTNRLLTRDATDWDFAENPVPSPDGKQIAYRFGEKDSTIRIINADGTRMRTLVHDGHANYMTAWSPDMKHIAAVRSNGDRTDAIVLLSTADGSPTQLKSTQGATLGGFSPDGRFLVYATGGNPNNPGTEMSGVFLLETNGSGEVPLVQGSATFQSPVWSPDGRHVIFKSNRSGSPALWSIRITAGRPEGIPVLLRANVDTINPIMGFTRDGSFYYGVRESQTEAYIADFDPQRLAVSNPLPVTDRFPGRNSEPELSPDGSSIAFIRRVGQGPQLVVRSLTTGEERTPVPNFQTVYGARTLQWFPDSRSLLVTDNGGNRRKRFRRIDVVSGESKTLFEGPWEVWTGALSPDGNKLFYSMKEGTSLRLVSRGLDSGEETELYRTSYPSDGTGLFGLTVSPDGTQIAFAPNVDSGGTVLRALTIVPTAIGGAAKEIIRSDQLFAPNAMSWTEDGRHLILTGKAADESQQLLAISTDGGELRPLGVRMQDIPSRMISADGRRIAFTGSTSKQELWVIRNLLSEPAKAK